jgi:dGTPase
VNGGVKSSPVYRHHVENIKKMRGARTLDGAAYENTEPNQLVVDYIASMTDDYFIELHGFLFKNSPYKVRYKGYFEE